MAEINEESESGSAFSAGQEIVVYVGAGVNIALPFDKERETLWASQAQIEDLFQLDQSVVSRHIRNVFKDSEVDQEGNSMQNSHKTSPRSPGRPATYYSLDVILAVGYRANSGRAIQFRRWANAVLKEYVIKGVAVNEQRLEELGSVVRVLYRSDEALVSGVADVLASYMPGIRLIREYDEGNIVQLRGASPGWELTEAETREIVDRLAAEFPSDTMLGVDPTGKLESSISTVYQTFDGQALYPTVEEQAANLLYLVVKDHPLVDGNKRTAAALFVTFLDRNGILKTADGSPKFTNNALAALTLMVAMSDAHEKDLIAALIARMLTNS